MTRAIVRLEGLPEDISDRPGVHEAEITQVELKENTEGLVIHAVWRQGEEEDD